jgi:formylglycine-generating enzyme required for sulfatase activity
MQVPSFNTEFDRLFAFGIDPDSTKQPQDSASDWPGIEEVQAYNRRIREAVDQVAGHAPEELLHVAMEHRLMHAETFAYMLHNLSRDRRLPAQVAPPLTGAPVRSRMVSIPEGTVALGRRPEDGFGWDNEFQQHFVWLNPFAIGKYKVTNGEYLAYVEAGGTPSHFWEFQSGRWFFRGMFDDIPLPLTWPVYVTYDQAAKYAAWAGKRLPTEAEYARAAYVDGSRSDPFRDNYDCCGWDPVPVNAAPANPLGVVQMTGNGWEWTSTEFGPFPGFRPFPFYPGYSEPFFDGKHHVLKGASPRTAARLTRPSFRNWFRSSYPYVYATFRMAET